LRQIHVPLDLKAPELQEHEPEDGLQCALGLYKSRDVLEKQRAWCGEGELQAISIHDRQLLNQRLNALYFKKWLNRW